MICPSWIFNSNCPLVRWLQCPNFLVAKDRLSVAKKHDGEHVVQTLQNRRRMALGGYGITSRFLVVESESTCWFMLNLPILPCWLPITIPGRPGLSRSWSRRSPHPPTRRASKVPEALMDWHGETRSHGEAQTFWWLQQWISHHWLRNKWIKLYDGLLYVLFVTIWNYIAIIYIYIRGSMWICWRE